jgi:RNA polymerase sigma-70 factor (ECF subfamily)
MFNNQKDKSLIAQGNQKKFRQLMELTADELLHFAMGFLRNKEVAEEIISDVYVKIWNNRAEITKIHNLKSYLFICVKNGCLSYLRKIKNEKIVFLDEYKDFHFIPVDGPEDDNLDKETIKEIHKAINALPPKCKLAFTLAKINGLKHKEIAEVMEVSEKTVNNHLVSAVKKITEMMGVEKKSRKPKNTLKQASLFSYLF